jgi:hypothetical protein
MYIACLVISILHFYYPVFAVTANLSFFFFCFQILNFLSSSHFIGGGLYHITDELLSNSQVTNKYNCMTGLFLLFVVAHVEKA